MADVRLVPCLSDNYAVLFHAEGETILVDAPEAAPIKAALAQTGWHITRVLITHHHSDHAQALSEVRGDAKAYGPKAEAGKITGLDETIADGATVAFGTLRMMATATPGHTAGHISYHFPDHHVAFTGDTLFAMGCGRLFEGDPATMWASLKRLRTLYPDETDIYCGHEYTHTNARYAHQTLPADKAIEARLASVEAARAQGIPTVPTTMALEKATNPFMRADDPTVAAALGLEGADPVTVFAKLRAGRDKF